MAYAPTNIDPKIVNGEFREKEYQHSFNYTDDPSIVSDWDREHGATHRVWVGGIYNETRPARVLKTVCHIMTDEEDVWEKWYIINTWSR